MVYCGVMQKQTRNGRRFFTISVAGAALIWGVLVVGGCNRDIKDSDVQEISLAEVRMLIADRPDETLLLDVRPVEAFESGHLPEAVNRRLSDLPREGKDPSLARRGTLVVYGSNPGDVAAKAMSRRLLRLGYDRVRWYSSGIDEWRRLGLPVE